MHHPSNIHLRLIQIPRHRRRRFHLCPLHRTNLLPTHITTITNSRSRSNSPPCLAGPRNPAGKHDHQSSRMGVCFPRTTTRITRPIPKTILSPPNGATMARFRPRFNRGRHRSYTRLSDRHGEGKRNHHIPGRRSHWCH